MQNWEVEVSGMPPPTWVDCWQPCGLPPRAWLHPDPFKRGCNPFKRGCSPLFNLG